MFSRLFYPTEGFRGQRVVKRPIYRSSAGIAILALLLSGCGSSHWEVPAAKGVVARNPQLPEVPSPEETIRGEDDPAVVTLKIGNSLHEKHLSRADSLPSSVIVPTTNLQNVPVTAALEAVLAGTDISLAYQGDQFNDRLVTLLNLNGPLPKVVQRICSAARIFCVPREGNLELKERESFVIELPPIERALGRSSSSASANGTSTTQTVAPSATNATNTIVEAISQLAGSKASADDAGGNLIYTTDVEGQEKVKKYLEQLRNGRPLVVIQMYIWEVSLDSEAATGINWQDLTIGKIGGNFENLALSSDTALTALTGGVSMGAVLSGKVSARVIANFLSTQGVVQTLSNPQLTFVSGSSAEFRVGGTRSYVSSVGQLNSTTTTATTGSTNGSTGVGTNTVSTDKVETGLRINVNGSYESGVIFSTLSIAITDLIRIESVNTGTTTLQLPETSNRDFSTVLRMRPGDNVVLAGMTSSRDDLARDRLNLPVLDGLPLRKNDQTQNRELVVLLKPAIVFFAEEKALEDDAAATAAVDAANVSNAAAAVDAAAPPNAQIAAAAPVPENPAPPPIPFHGIVVDKAVLQAELARIFDQWGATTTGVP